MAHALFAAPVFDAPGSNLIESEEGKATVVWSLPDASTDTNFEFQLQQSDDAQFSSPKTLYQGPDLGTVVTGLPEGDYFYRVRELTGPHTHGHWSDTLTVRVEYPARRTVEVLMLVGLAVFVGTVSAVVIGHFRTSPRREGPPT